MAARIDKPCGRGPHIMPQAQRDHLRAVNIQIQANRKAQRAKAGV